MAVKYAFFLVCLFVVLYFVQAVEVKTNREKTASETIDETYEKIKTGVSDLVDKVKNNEFVQNASKVLGEFGETVGAKGKELLNNLKNENH